MKNSPKQKGFMLIELLVVVSITCLLSSMILVATKGAREKARLARAKSDLRQLANAIAILASDTTKWPNGCPAGEWENPEVYFDDPRAGLVSVPPLGRPPNFGSSGPTRASCEWLASDIAGWKGPYAQVPLDPWGNRYLFDPDYCSEEGLGVVALVSVGPDGLEEYKSAACGLSNNFMASGPPPGDDIVVYPASTLIPLP